MANWFIGTIISESGLDHQVIGGVVVITGGFIPDSTHIMALVFIILVVFMAITELIVAEADITEEDIEEVEAIANIFWT